MDASEKKKRDADLKEKISKRLAARREQPDEKKALSKKSKSKLEQMRKLHKEQLKELEKEVAEKEQEASENYELFLRLNAEFDNFKKRSVKDKSDFFKYSGGKLIRDFIGIIDDLERAVEAARNNKEAEDLRRGVEMTMNKIKNLLESNGAKQFHSLGETFDPNKHEAISKVTTTKHKNDIVVEELRKGYMYHDRLLRPAMVVIAENVTGNVENKNKEAEENDKANQEKAVN